MPAGTDASIGPATRILFFTGKGGVGKTSLACATAIGLADGGRRVLLVSTDPASNLDEVLGTALDRTPRDVAGVERLHALNIDPEAAARAYRERVVGPYRGLLPASAVARIEEQLSGACTTEIAAFDEFTRLLGSDDIAHAYDHVVFDTAPTGHTLRLLALPAAWNTFIDTNTTGTSCLGPLAGLQAQHVVYRASLAALTDAHVTTVVLVTRPDASAIAEADRTRLELAALGMRNLHLAINGVFETADAGDPIANALERRGRAALEAMPEGLRALPTTRVPLRPWAPLGITRLRSVLGEGRADEAQPAAAGEASTAWPTLHALVDGLAARGRGVILAMGKGGVGKTTVASAIAVDLAQRGHHVHLSTTDPAAHLAGTLTGGLPRITQTRIDPEAETRAYADEVMQVSGPLLDEKGRALLEEDLRSPCTEEIAVFRAFARTVAAGTGGFVVLDTAPTGHTLLLLDAAEAYHREVERTQGDVPDEVRHLLPRLRDPEFASVILVTLPEATPVHEAAQLQDDLRRAAIEPYAWVVNQSFAGLETTDPVLQARGRREAPYLDEVRLGLASRTARIPWRPEPPVGPAQLEALALGRPAATPARA